MIAVLTTAERPHYLDATLADLDDQSGEQERHLFFDGPTDGKDRPGWRVHSIEKRDHGNAAAIWSVLRFAARTGDDLVFFEDDVTTCRNVVPYLEAFRVPADLAFVAFLSEFTSDVCPWGLYRAHPMAFMLCQALKFSAVGLSAIVAVRDRPQSRHGDTELGAALEAAGMRWGAHVPDLVRHVGEISMANPDSPLAGVRVGRTFPRQGPSFDAVAQLASATKMGLYT